MYATSLTLGFWCGWSHPVHTRVIRLNEMLLAKLSTNHIVPRRSSVHHKNWPNFQPDQICTVCNLMQTKLQNHKYFMLTWLEKKQGFQPQADPNVEEQLFSAGMPHYHAGLGNPSQGTMSVSSTHSSLSAFSPDMACWVWEGEAEGRRSWLQFAPRTKTTISKSIDRWKLRISCVANWASAWKKNTAEKWERAGDQNLEKLGARFRY